VSYTPSKDILELTDTHDLVPILIGAATVAGPVLSVVFSSLVNRSSAKSIRVRIDDIEIELKGKDADLQTAVEAVERQRAARLEQQAEQVSSQDQ
jgi:hypothetical protein